MDENNSVSLRFDSSGILYLTIEVMNGNGSAYQHVEFIVDTGFNGFFQLDKESANSLGFSATSTTVTRGFDNVEKEVGSVKGNVKLQGLVATDVPIHIVENGNKLVGTAFFAMAKTRLVIDYNTK